MGKLSYNFASFFREQSKDDMRDFMEDGRVLITV
jgi:hypothetical protein